MSENPGTRRARPLLVAALGHLPLLLLMAAGVLLSLYAAGTMADLDRDRREAEFFRRADRAVTDLHRALSGPMDVVAQLATFYAASEEVTPGEFDEYASSVRSRHPEVVELAWRPVDAADASGGPTDAFATAAREGRLSSSGPLAAEAGRAGPDFVLVRPLYRARGARSYRLAGTEAELVGFVTARVDVGMLAERSRRDGTEREYVLDLVDPARERPDGLLYRSPGIPDVERTESPRLVRSLPFADRTWQAVCHFPAETLDAPPGLARSLVLAGCLLLTAFASILFLVLRRTSGIAALTRRQAERLTEEVAERRRAEERYRTLVEGAVFGIFRTTADGRILDANPAAVEMLGYASEADLHRLDVGRGIYADPEEREGVLAQFRDSPRRTSATVRCRRADGTTGWFRVTGRAVPVAPGEEEVFESMVEDVTEAIRLEEQLRRSRRVEAMGRLAGGVAHDFNNLLTVVLGQCRQLREMTDLPAGAIERLDDIEGCGERAARLTRQLLAFARQQVMRPKLLDLNTVLERLLPILRRMIGEDFALRLDPTPEIGPVRVDPTQIEQVVMNLVLNARNSMPSGGEIRLATGEATISGEEHHGSASAPGDYVLLTVEDRGVGMDEETRAHVFEPFFTTRASHGGTGLGLATAFGIVRQSGGFLRVWSEPGEGSTFEVYLPRVPGAVAEAERGDRDAEASPDDARGTETILLAEDERSLLELMRDALTGEGYTVLAARNGAQAWRIFEERESEIDALVTDLVMPELRGDELARRLRERRPELPVLAMSGYSRHAVKNDGALGAAAFLEKPFELREFLRTVRRMLELTKRRDGPDQQGADPGRHTAGAGEHGGAGDREREDEERQADVELRDVVEPGPGE